jgi:hypothetical protein
MHAYVYVCMHDFCFEEMCICAPPDMHTHMHSTYAKMIIVLDVYINLNLWRTCRAPEKLRQDCLILDVIWKTALRCTVMQ